MKVVQQRSTLVRRTAKHRTADLIVETLERAGIDAVFGIPGGTICSINDALLDRPSIRVVTTRHESGAMFAAAGYARATGKVAAVIVTSGPGALNCMTGLASAYCDSLPVLVLAGEVPTHLFGKGALQEGSSSSLNIVGMARNITKFSHELTDPKAAPAVVGKAIEIATEGRPGPVLLTLPLDVTTASIRRPGLIVPPQPVTPLNARVLARIAHTIDQAHRPIIFAGSGCRWGEGPALVRALAERLQCPVLTTPKAKGVFPESHPLSMGVFGHGGHGGGVRYLEEQPADVMLALGTGLTDPATDGWSDLLIPTNHFIQVDTDPLRIGRNYEVDIGLVAPVAQVLCGLLDNIEQHPPSPVRHGIVRWTDPSMVDPSRPISPQRALWELQRRMPASTRYACDIGEHLLFTTHYLNIDDPQGFLIMTGLASMGSSIPGAIGMRLGRPDTESVAICGDGCFAMSLGDLGTAVREGVPIVVAVLNDRRYGMVELGHMSIFGRSPSYACNELQVDVLARGLGADAHVIERPNDILELDALNGPRTRPLVLDIRVDVEARMPRNQRFEALGSENKRS